MADLTSAYSNKGTGTRLTGDIQCEVLEREATRCKIKITVRCWLTSGYSYATLIGKLTKGGELIAEKTWGTSSKIDCTPVTVVEAEYWENYDTSGTASATIDCTVTIRDSGSFSGTISGSESVSDKAPYSASKFTVNKTTVKHGEHLIFDIVRDAPILTHTLHYWNGVTSKWVQIDANVGGSYDWLVPDLAHTMPSSVSGNLWLLCTTYNGSANIGTHQIKITMTVPDATKPTIEDNTATIGTAKTVYCRRGSTNFRSLVTFTIGNRTEEIANMHMESFSWTPSYEFAKEIPDLTYGTGTLTCKTYNGTAFVGEVSTSVKLVVPEDDTTRPAFTTEQLALSVVTSLPESFAGMYIRGRTGVRADFSATSAYSRISECSISVGSIRASGNPSVIDTIIDDGDVRVTATVKDARGFTRTVTTSISVFPYQKPKIMPYSGYSSVVCERAKSNGELSADGTLLAVRAGKSFSGLSVDGVNKNACQLRYRYKTASSDVYNSWITLISENSPETQISTLISDIVNSTSTSYDVELNAIDTIGGEHTLHFQIMTGRVSFVLYDGVDGAGFGKYPEAPHIVDIAAHMTLLVRGQLVILGSEWENLLLANGVKESATDIGRADGCKYKVENGNHVYVAFNCSFNFTGTTLTVNSTHIPSECRPARDVRSICPVNGNGTAVVTVTKGGLIQVEYVERPGEAGSHAVLWIDGYLDYWI